MYVIYTINERIVSLFVCLSEGDRGLLVARRRETHEIDGHDRLDAVAQVSQTPGRGVASWIFPLIPLLGAGITYFRCCNII